MTNAQISVKLGMISIQGVRGVCEAIGWVICGSVCPCASVCDKTFPLLVPNTTAQFEDIRTTNILLYLPDDRAT